MLRDRFVTWLDRRTTPGGGKAMLARLESAGVAVAKGPYLAHRDFRPALSPEDAALVEALVGEIMASGFDPAPLPALKASAGLSKQRLKVLEDLAKTEARLVMFAPQHYIAATVMANVKQRVRELGDGRRFKLADVRDALKLSRRVVQPLLEHLDRIGFTRRVGDERVLVDITR